MSNNLLKLNAIIKDHISERRINYILETAAKKVQEDIKNLAPVDTGTYRDSIQVGPVIKEGNIYRIEIFSDLKVGGTNNKWSNIPLGYLLEWGTGVRGQSTNKYEHGLPYRQTPWTYYNDRYGKWIFTHGNVAVPHFYPGLHLNETYFKDLIRKEICKK